MRSLARMTTTFASRSGPGPLLLTSDRLRPCLPRSGTKFLTKLGVELCRSCLRLVAWSLTVSKQVAVMLLDAGYSFGPRALRSRCRLVWGRWLDGYLGSTLEWGDAVG